MALTQVNAGLIDSTSQPNAFKNRIINGAMMIDQRNAGASVTQTTSDVYPVDRFLVNGTVTSKFTAQQNAGSVTPPSGFVNYLGCTSSASTSLGATDYYIVRHTVEGLNVADLGWGAAGASPVTLSFWVRSSLTGTFGGSLFNSAANRNYAFSYTISAANTWEQKTVTIAGDTSGTWLKTNGAGIYINWSLGTGSTYSGSTGSWGSSVLFSATGATSVVGTNGATFYITGVQLEKGSTATSFDYRSYGTELALCQRYYVRIVSDASYSQFGIGVLSGSSAGSAYFPFPVTMRAVATSVDYSGIATCNYPSAPAVAITGFSLNAQQTKYAGNVSWSTGSSAGSTGNPIQIIANNNASAYVGFGAEL